MTTKIRWAPRVPMEWLKRLYAQDALGIVDDELIEKVGYRLYERCRDCVLVARSIRGDFSCVDCRASCDVTDDVIVCSSCGWSYPLAEFRLSWRHKELTADPEFVVRFIADWERARTYTQKMLAIDGVIHRWHHETKTDKGIGRPIGVNVIEGSRKQVIAFLDELSAGPNHERWSAINDRVKAKVRAWKTR